MGLLDEIEELKDSVETVEELSDDFQDALEDLNTVDETQPVVDEEDEEDVEIKVNEKEAVIYHDRDVQVVEQVYNGDKYIVVGNVLNHRKGSVFSGSLSQIKELLELKMIKPYSKLSNIEKATLEV
jgi:predicted nuclease of predicted toxin-antitoxin system